MLCCALLCCAVLCCAAWPGQRSPASFAPLLPALLTAAACALPLRVPVCRAGGGNTGDAQCPRMAANQNVLLAYGPLAAAHFEADFQVTAVGGAGLVARPRKWVPWALPGSSHNSSSMQGPAFALSLYSPRAFVSIPAASTA